MEARARSGGLANDLGGVPPDYFVIKLYQMLREQKEVIASVPASATAPPGRFGNARSILNARFVARPRARRLSNSNSGGDLEGLRARPSDAASPPSPRVLPPPVPTAASALASALARPGGPVAGARRSGALLAAARRAGALPFPCVLKDMIDNTPDDVVAWSDDGRVFLRQLSLYQFRRARMQRPAAPDGRPAAKPHGGGLPLAYHHPKFVRGRPARRRSARSRARGAKPPAAAAAPPPPPAADAPRAPRPLGSPPSPPLGSPPSPAAARLSAAARLGPPSAGHVTDAGTSSDEDPVKPDAAAPADDASRKRAPRPPPRATTAPSRRSAPSAAAATTTT
ncbi:hypothetical protein SO694_0000449 [Aureococcus anophagefferens]|uniref:HSF-type DNA-binding domain-containing protein n=1 Tax=Aureococcus anophagefferens TaxID=44056 RepID=A0ABR1G9N6_AURAN